MMQYFHITCAYPLIYFKLSWLLIIPKHEYCMNSCHTKGKKKSVPIQYKYNLVLGFFLNIYSFFF